MRMCSYCLGEVAETATKCKHCGEWLQGINNGRDDTLRDLSSRNPAIRQAETNVETVRFVWKAAALLYLGAIVLSLMEGGESNQATWYVVLVGGCVVVGMLAGALLSSVSHIVELLAILLRSELYRQNHLSQKLQKLQQALHE